MTLFVSRLHLTNSVSSPHHSSPPNQDWNGWISLAQRIMFPMDVRNVGPIARASVVKICITTHGTTDGNNIHLSPDVFATGVLIILMIILRVMFRTARNIVFVFLVLYSRDYGGGWETESIVLIVASLLSDLKRTRGDVSAFSLYHDQPLTITGMHGRPKVRKAPNNQWTYRKGMSYGRRWWRKWGTCNIDNEAYTPDASRRPNARVV